jgi:hypothetical protein
MKMVRVLWKPAHARGPPCLKGKNIKIDFTKNFIEE